MPEEYLTPEILRIGYSQAAFPMTMEDGEIGWFRPTRRTIFPNGGFHLSTSLRKALKRVYWEGSSLTSHSNHEPLHIKFDTAFSEVMRSCMRPGEDWISEHFIQVYSESFRLGWGHCAEVWAGDELVGGVYGLSLGAAFFAESMFHRKTNCSKIALWALLTKCEQLGFELFDAQYMTPHLVSLGAVEITAKMYDRALAVALSQPPRW